MAKSSSTALNTILDPQGTGKICRIIKSNPGATVDLWYVVDESTYDKKSKWVETTVSDSASDQATAILTAMAPAV